MRLKARTAAATPAITSIAAAAALAFALPASATVIYSTGFEAPDFTTGALAGQGGWSVSNGTSIVTVENTFVHGGAQAVGLGPGDYGAYHTDLFTPTEQVVVSMDVYYASGSGIFFQISVGSALGPSGITAGVNLFPAGANAITPSFPGIGAVSQNAWHNVAMTLDYATQTYDISVDGSPVASDLAFCGGEANSLTCLGNHVSQFDDVQVSTDARINSAASYIDNVSISEEGVPEPGAWALMLVGMAGLGGALRQRRRAMAAA